MRKRGEWQHTGRDTLHTTTTSETADSRLGDALDVVTQDLAMALSTALAEALSAFAACAEMLLAFAFHRIAEGLMCQGSLREEDWRCGAGTDDGHDNNVVANMATDGDVPKSRKER